MRKQMANAIFKLDKPKRQSRYKTRNNRQQIDKSEVLKTLNALLPTSLLQQIMFPSIKTPDWIPIRLPQSLREPWLKLSEAPIFKQHSIRTHHHIISDTNKHLLARLIFELHYSTWINYQKLIAQSSNVNNKALNTTNISVTHNQTPSKPTLTPAPSPTNNN